MKIKFNPALPLESLRLPLRFFLSLLPTILFFGLAPLHPDMARITPAIFHYPLVFVATWLGGFIPGLISILVCSAYSLFFIRPHLMSDFFSDPAGLARSSMFFSTSLLFISLVALLQKALKKAEEAITVRDDFILMASHELRTPITTIKLNLEVAKEKLKNNEKSLYPTLDTLQRQINRQEKLITSMLDLSLIEAGHLGIRKEYFDLSPVVEKATLAAKDSLHEDTVMLSLKSLKGYGDKQRIEQAIFNLVHNALKYGLKNTVKVSLYASGNNAVIQVSNSGTAIPEKFHEQIFKKFQRPHLPFKVQGLGIGLYLARIMIELHEGKLDLTSSTDEETVFTVTLPLN